MNVYTVQEAAFKMAACSWWRIASVGVKPCDDAAPMDDVCVVSCDEKRSQKLAVKRRVTV